MSLFCNVAHAWCTSASSFRNTFLQRQQQKCQQKIYKKRDRDLYMFTALQKFPLFWSEGGREPLTVVWVEEVSVDVSRKAFLYSFHLFLFFFLLLLFKHGSWRPIKTHNQKQLVVVCFVLKRSNPLHFGPSLKSKHRNVKRNKAYLHICCALLRKTWQYNPSFFTLCCVSITTHCKSFYTLC